MDTLIINRTTSVLPERQASCNGVLSKVCSILLELKLNEVVELLIRSSKDHGIDLSSIDHSGSTALHYAFCLRRNLVIAKLIFENYKDLGIDLKHKNNDGRTALDYLIRGNDRHWDKDWKEFEYLVIEENRRLEK